MADNTPLDLLNQMLATDPHAAEAERLLRHLVVFQGLFPRDAIVRIAPDEMSSPQRIEAFATLCQWRIVRKKSQRRYQIDESIKALYPPSRDVLIRYVGYWEGRFSTLDDIYLYVYWDDITFALAWGLRHWPEKIEAIRNGSFTQNWLIYRPHSPHLIDLLREFMEPLDISLIATQAWQDQFLEHYIEVSSQNGQLYRMLCRAQATFINQDLALARQYYEQAIGLANATAGPNPSQIHISLLQNLLDVLILQKDMAAFYATVDQLLPLVQANAYNLHQLGLMMMCVDNKATARHCFAQGLRLIDEGRQRNHFQGCFLYRDWAHVEKSNGHIQETEALYHLAMREAAYYMEQSLLWENPRWTEEGYRLVMRLKREWKAIVAQYIDLIPPDKPSQQS
jgi:hypothetical protein